MPTTDPRVDAYIARAAEFARPVLTHLRACVHAACPAVQETIKWGMPFFMVDGRNVVFMAAFKAHCGFGFWKGSQVPGVPEGSEGMGQFGKLTNLRDLPPRRQLVSLIKTAAGWTPVPAKTPRRPPAA